MEEKISPYFLVNEFRKRNSKISEKKNKQKNLILSGGSSITKIYRKISKIKANWKNINIYLVDERKTSKKKIKTYFY